jgi:hypothetical protein
MVFRIRYTIRSPHYLGGRMSQFTKDSNPPYATLIGNDPEGSIADDAKLMDQMKMTDTPHWWELAPLFPDKTSAQLIRRMKRMTNPRRRLQTWIRSQDELIINWVQMNGPTKWSHLVQLLPGRTAKQCWGRWHTQLDPNLKRGKWQTEEDAIIEQLHRLWGNQWSRIARFLPGRNDNAVKNRWNSNLRHCLTRLHPGLLVRCTGWPQPAPAVLVRRPSLRVASASSETVTPADSRTGAGAPVVDETDQSDFGCDNGWDEIIE